MGGQEQIPRGGWCHAEQTSYSGVATCSSAPTGAVDLTAGSITPASATVGQPVTLSATIANIGTVSSASGFTNLFQRANNAAGTGAIDIGTHANNALAANDSNAAIVEHTFPSTGTYYVRACADKSSAADTGSIPESNQTNNCGPWTAVTVASTCPAGQSWNGSSCVPEVPTCPAGQSWNGSACACPSGQTWNGTSCVTDPPTCPAGQTWNGSSCVNTGGGSLSCTVSDTSVNVGETVTYSASGGSEPYTWTPADSHPHNYGSAAHVNRTFTASGNFGMTVSKPSYTSGNCPVVVVGTPACTSSSATIEADPDRVRKGDDTIVTWSASGGGACALSCVVTENGSTLSTDASGSEERTINEQTVYRISCGGGGEDEVVVNLIPGFIEF